jgi:GT2 family glycosyltransferase
MEKHSSPFVSLIIVYWNSARYFPRCLESLSLQTFRNFEIIIVNNGSSDEGLKDLERKYPKLDFRIEHLQSNIGFAAANNLGAQFARGKWLILLNTDAFPEPDWLENLTTASKSNPEIASFSSRQIQANAPELLDSTGDAYHVSGLAWHIGLGYPCEQYGLDSGQIFSPCAAAAMYLRQAFLEVGGFDEDFFSYFEDVDLGFRLQLKGYRSLYVADAIVHHIGSAALGAKSDFAFYHVHRNMIWTFVKNMPSTLLWRYLPAHLFANLVYLLYYSLRGRGKALWRAKWHALKELKEVLRKRRLIQSYKLATSAELTQRMEHGFLKPYLLRYERCKALRAKY